MAKTQPETLPSVTETPMPDQGFRVYQTHGLQALRSLETAITKYANLVMKNLNKYQLMPGTTDKGFFPHGRVDFKQNVFTPTADPGPEKPESMVVDYPAKLKDDDVVTVVEDGDSLILVSELDPNVSASQRFPVPPGTHLIVYGNVVRIDGKVAAPGKHIVIVAREIRTRADKEGAELNVDGKQPPRAMASFVESAGRGADATQAAGYYTEMPDPSFAAQGGAGSPGAHGARGESGSPAGEIFIVCDCFEDASTLTLSARGGQGQDGQRGQDGGGGGQGGRGQDEIPEGPPAIESGPGGCGGDGGIGGPGGTGGAAGNCTVIVNHPLPPLCTLTMHLQPGIAGNRGAGGDGGPEGPRGAGGVGRLYPVKQDPMGGNHQPGHRGDEVLQWLTQANKVPPTVADSPPALWARLLVCHNADLGQATAQTNDPRVNLRGVAKFSHLDMVFESARERYLQWDAYRFAGDAKADTIKNEVIALLEFLRIGLSLAVKFPGAEDAQVRKDIGDMVAGWALKLAQGQDYFGHTEDFVPLGSPNVYLNSFNDALRLLAERETRYLNYTSYLAQKKAITDEREMAIAAVTSDLATQQTGLDTLRAALEQLVKQIRKYDDAIVNAGRTLRDALTNLHTAIEFAPGLTPEDFINCLFNLAFIGDPTRPHPTESGQLELAGHGVFTGLTTISSQASTLINKAVNTLPDDEGQPVNRKHLLRRVERFGKKLTSLTEAWTAIRSDRNPTDPELIKLVDDDAYRLLAAQRDFDEMLDRFSEMPQAEAAVTAMDAYVAVVQQRNAVLADYNTVAAEYIRIAGERAQLQSHKDDLDNVMATHAEPNLPAETAFATALYKRTRERCVALCYLASRAYRFWTLVPNRALYDALKLGNPGQINHAVLSAAVESLYDAKTKEIEAGLARPKEVFPSDPKGTGIFFVLTPDTHPTTFAGLRQHGVGSFVIPVPGPNDTVATNPFEAHAAVRITKVRPWVLGVQMPKGCPNCTVVIRHKVRDAEAPEPTVVEWFRAWDKTILSFQHPPLEDHKFIYDPAEVSWNKHYRCVEGVAKAFQHSASDGTLIAQGGYANSKYPPVIGPHVEWEILLPREFNTGDNNKPLDTRGISMVAVEFHGYSQTPHVTPKTNLPNP